MPNYGRLCGSCGWSVDFSIERVKDVDRPCPRCHMNTERVYQGAGSAVIPDTYTTPVVDDVMTKETQVFHSRSERRDAMRANNLRERVQHVGTAEGDKSSHTIRWVGTAQPEAERLADRQAKLVAQWGADAREHV